MKALDRNEVAAVISRMAFRTIDPDKSLNIYYQLGGDEIESIFDRVCDHYRKDKDDFWSNVDFGTYFYPEASPIEPLAFVGAALLHVTGAMWFFRRSGINRPPEKTQLEFTVDTLIKTLEKCKDA